MKLEKIETKDELKNEELVNIKGGLSDDILNDPKACQQCNCFIGNKNTPPKPKPSNP